MKTVISALLMSGIFLSSAPINYQMKDDRYYSDFECETWNGYRRDKDTYGLRIYFDCTDNSALRDFFRKNSEKIEKTLKNLPGSAIQWGYSEWTLAGTTAVFAILLKLDETKMSFDELKTIIEKNNFENLRSFNVSSGEYFCF